MTRARLKLDVTNPVVIDALLDIAEKAMPALDLPRVEAESKLPGLQSALRYLLAFEDEPDTITEGKTLEDPK
jgi:hypothetical protein